MPTPLHNAIKNGHYDACGLLLDHGACIYCPLLLAAKYGHTHICELLLGHGVSIDEEDNVGTALHYAAGDGHLDTCKYLIEKGLDVNHINELDLTPLHDAATEGHADVCKLLLDHGSDVDLGAENGYGRYMTPLLHVIQYCKDYDTCKVLLDANADVNLHDGWGRTPLVYAINEEDADLCRLLISYGAIGDDCGCQGNYSNDDLRDYIRSIGEDPSCIVDEWPDDDQCSVDDDQCSV
jgi:ankyrin repeat protein